MCRWIGKIMCTDKIEKKRTKENLFDKRIDFAAATKKKWTNECDSVDFYQFDRNVG